MISAIILAAGESNRMGQPKLLLPWGSMTVLEHVLMVYQAGGLTDLLVISGGARTEVEELAKVHQVKCIFNPDYKGGEMVSSIQLGLKAQNDSVEATLICLADQPQVQPKVIKLILARYAKHKDALIVPSYQMRRGHPWLIARPLWSELIDLKPPRSARDFLNDHTAHIRYMPVDTPSVLEDIDTPADYQKHHSQRTSAG